MTAFLSREQFTKLVQEGYNLIPLTRVALADMDTPLSLYAKLANVPNSFLLESVQGGERFGRYSFIGLSAHQRLEVHDHTCHWFVENQLVREEIADPLFSVKEWLARVRVPRLQGLPRFCGGVVGYFGHDVVRLIEPRLSAGRKKGDKKIPDMILLWCDELAIVDNLACTLTLVVHADARLPDAYDKAQARLSDLSVRINAPATSLAAQTVASVDNLTYLVSRESFIRQVERAKEYIEEGDLMQVVLSQPMVRDLQATPLSLYRALRTINPSPYLFYFDFGRFHVAGASPEILVRLEKNKVVLRPVAGTRYRGATEEEDQRLAAELLADKKERAEHLMLLDLGRNDVGRVSKAGSVKVSESFSIERYSHVMHIVSQVEGELKEGLTAMEVLCATFPAGTLSGAPKVRALEIIDELEIHRREIYGGAVGYISFQGDMDLAIAIRMAVIKNDKLHVQAGCGVVADSDPASEWIETCNKAKAVLRAAQMAEEGLNVHPTAQSK